MGEEDDPAGANEFVKVDSSLSCLSLEVWSDVAEAQAGLVLRFWVNGGVCTSC